MIEHTVRWRSDTRLKRVGRFLVPEVVIHGEFDCQLVGGDDNPDIDSSELFPTGDMDNDRGLLL